MQFSSFPIALIPCTNPLATRTRFVGYGKYEIRILGPVHFYHTSCGSWVDQKKNYHAA